jgi:dTDP-4-dehydrorhamnose 3,5-epimerase
VSGTARKSVKSVTWEAMPGVKVVTLQPHVDARGRFTETFRQEWFPGRPAMVQGNRSDSEANVLRGLHYHLKQADYWYVPFGRVFVALADLRKGSPVRGSICTFEIGGEGKELGVYIPPGVAHGYYAVVRATMTYMVDQYYDTNDELGVAWDDPELSIPWPLVAEAPLLSPRDQKNPRVAALDPTRLPP